MRNVEEEYRRSDEYKRGLERFIASKPDRERAEEYLGAFVDDCFVRSCEGSVRGVTVQGLYKEWVKKNSINKGFKVSNRELGKLMKVMFESRRLANGIHYMGLEEKPQKEYDQSDYIVVNREHGVSNGVVYTPEEVIVFAKEYLLESGESEVEFVDVFEADQKLDKAGLSLVSYSEELYERYNRYNR